MGNESSCEKCEPASSGSVVNLSDDCVDRLTGDEIIKDGKIKEKLVMQESARMENLRCIDDAHSNAYGLNLETFERLVRRIEKLSKGEDALPCTRTTLIACLKQNPTCMSRCRKLMEEFIDCVDAMRINKIKAKIQEDRKKLQKQEVNDLLRKSLDNKDIDDE